MAGPASGKFQAVGKTCLVAAEVVVEIAWRQGES